MPATRRAMRLSMIGDRNADRELGPARDGRAVPKTAEQADALFFRGLQYMDAGRDEDAYANFAAVAAYSDGHPELIRAARQCRDFLDPDNSPRAKAEVLGRVFTPRLVRIKFDDAARDAAAQP